MKILLIHDYGTATGGAELQILALKRDFTLLGHEVRLFSSDVISVAGSELQSEYQCFGTTSLLQVISQTANISAYQKLATILREFEPDIVHIRMFLWQISPLILPLLKDYPTLYQTAVYKCICPNGRKILPDGSFCQFPAGKACLQTGCLTPQSWLMLMVQRQLWQKWNNSIDLTVALSYKMKSVLEANGIKSVEVVHNGVELREIRPQLGETPIIGYAGRLSYEKGVSTIIKALAKIKTVIPEVKLLIAGQGQDETDLRNLAQELNLEDNITWLGYLPRTDLEKCFDTLWVQVIPSLWDEPFGNVTTEAMMRGTAVVASEVGAQPEIVEPNITGFLVPANDVNCWYDALLKLLNDRNLAEKMGRNGHQLAITKFSEQKRNDRFLELYHRIINTDKN